MSFEPTSPGTARDLRERTNLAREIPFFGSEAEAKLFAGLGVGRLRASLPAELFYVDFGGGQGVLAKVVRDYLLGTGRRVRAVVLDANEVYLEQARTSGLETVLANIEQSDLANLDLATMRLVNHYNDESRQRSMLEAVRRSLKDGGVFVSQIETGASAVCRLQTRVANLPSLNGGEPAGYFWPTLDTYLAWLRELGFREVEVAGSSPEIETEIEYALGAAWRRFNGRAFEQAVAAGDAAHTEEMLAQRRDFFREATALLQEALAQTGPGDEAAVEELRRKRLRLLYPIVVARR